MVLGAPGPSTEPRSVYGSGRNQACDGVVYRVSRYTPWPKRLQALYARTLALASSRRTRRPHNPTLFASSTVLQQSWQPLSWTCWKDLTGSPWGVLLYEALCGCFPGLPVSEAARRFGDKSRADASLAGAVTMTVTGPNVIAGRRAAGWSWWSLGMWSTWLVWELSLWKNRRKNTRVSWSIWAINTDIITQRVNKMLVPITFLSFFKYDVSGEEPMGNQGLENGWNLEGWRFVSMWHRPS